MKSLIKSYHEEVLSKEQRKTQMTEAENCLSMGPRGVDGWLSIQASAIVFSVFYLRGEWDIQPTF